MNFLRFAKRFKQSPPMLDRPVFIIGCGRSGTTVLGKMLGVHPDLAYLNEPRHIWLTAPETDIWTDKAGEREGKLLLTPSQATPELRDKLTTLFASAVMEQKGTRLLEKLPINSFRVDFIAALFPDARFIHLLRNGVEVARSIETYTQSKTWYGDNDYKWNLLTEHAASQGLREIADRCSTDNFLRGLLEWRLSVTAAQRSLAALPTAHCREIRYENLMINPEDSVCELMNFMEVSQAESVLAFASNQLSRRTSVIHPKDIPQEAHHIAGELLKATGYA